MKLQQRNDGSFRRDAMVMLMSRQTGLPARNGKVSKSLKLYLNLKHPPDPSG
jgi:hypothetical protein